MRETETHSPSHSSVPSEETREATVRRLQNDCPFYCCTALQNMPLKYVFPAFSPKPQNSLQERGCLKCKEEETNQFFCHSSQSGTLKGSRLMTSPASVTMASYTHLRLQRHSGPHLLELHLGQGQKQPRQFFSRQSHRSAALQISLPLLSYFLTTLQRKTVALMGR